MEIIGAICIIGCFIIVILVLIRRPLEMPSKISKPPKGKVDEYWLLFKETLLAGRTVKIGSKQCYLDDTKTWVICEEDDTTMWYEFTEVGFNEIWKQ